jgi:hypothetical protein
MKQVLTKNQFMERLPGPRKGNRSVDVQKAIGYLEEHYVTVAPCKYVIFKAGSVFMFEDDEALVDFVEREKD